MSPQGALSGTGVVPGIAVAPVLWVKPRPQVPVEEHRLDEAEREAEVQRFVEASQAVAQRLAERAAAASGAAAEVLGATAALAKDRGWVRASQKLIRAGTPAATATSEAIATFVARFQQLGGLMAERTTDLEDIRDRVVAELLGLPEPGITVPDHPVALLAADLAPSDTAGLDPTYVKALVTRLGGPTSHTAIIARQLGIPCIVAVDGLDDVAEGTTVVVDGSKGTVRWGVPDDEAQALVVADQRRRAEVAAWHGPARLASGEHVQLLANVQDGAGAQAAARSDAEGVGLFRTELCFLSATTEPTVEQQAEIYGEVLAAYPGSKVVVRTLDAGTDKPVPFASLADEENPALGVRGVRLSLSRDGMLARQLDGIAKASADHDHGGRTWVMAPMIATIDEARRFVAECRQRGLTAGIMVEVPSVAVLADLFLAEVDFLSIGTNDLTQYTMAADRLQPELASLTDPWQPAVLHLIARTATAGVTAGKPVGVCGEAAADPQLACVLVGLGVTSLSMAAPAIPAVGVQLGKATLDRCRAAAEAALAAPTAAAAREAAAVVLG